MTVDISDMTGSVQTIEIGGRTLAARKPDLESIFSVMERLVKDEMMGEIKELAREFDGKDKIDFLREARNDLPRGVVLSSMAWERMGSTPEGIRHVIWEAVKDQNVGITEGEIRDLVASEYFEAMDVASELVGAGVDTEKKMTAGPGSNGSTGEKSSQSSAPPTDSAPETSES